jgi:hypothetical protein
MSHASLRQGGLALVLVLSAAAALAAQTSPEAFLGHRVGADRKLADYNQIKAYFEKLDLESPRLKLVEIGTSTLGHPIVMAVITAEENMAKLDRWREIAARLKDGRDLSADDARALAREGKALVLITCSLHASEIAASQMSMELAYDLVTGRAPFDVDAVLRDVVVLLVPSHNPDGNIMVADWYRKNVGTKFEGANMPWLYHPYAGHDNNRDWFMFNLPETKAVTRVLYHDWLPQIHIDEHQMGSTGARLFIPPFMDPPLPNVQPLLWRSVNLMGTSMAFDLQKAGYPGVVNGRSFTGWWIGACDDTSWLHNTIGLLSEMASVRTASPIYIEPTEVPKAYAERRMDFIDPWPGGWWRLRNLVDYELVLSKSLVKTAALHKEDLLLNSYLMARDSVEKKDKGQPYAFVVSTDQRDPETALRMLDILKFGGVEIQRAAEAFTADGRVYPAGSFVVLAAQPYKAYAWALLERQTYPDLRQYPDGPPVPPYDNAGWTLPLQMGVACDEIEKPFAANLTKLDAIPAPDKPAVPAEASWFVLDAARNASYVAVFALLKEKAEIWRAKEPVKIGDRVLVPGAFLVKNTPAALAALPKILEKRPVPVAGLADISALPRAALKNPRIALYQSWRSNMDEGWTRFVFDDLGVPYTTVRNADLKGTKDKKPDLKARFDIIVFASEDVNIIKTGKPDQQSEYARYVTPMPPEYEGGIEKEGVEALKAFVENGGTLVTLNEACELATKELEAPARNALEKVERTKFFCPTSILKLDVDPTTPIGYGLPEETAAVFADSLALETRVPPMEWDRKIVASFPENGILESGWLLGEDVIARKAAVVDMTYKKGRIVLIAIRAQHRAQSHGTYKFLLNALLYPMAE